MGDNLCTYCMGARQLQGPDLEDVQCPRCRGTGIYPFLNNTETATRPSDPDEWRTHKARRMALAAIRKVMGVE